MQFKYIDFLFIKTIFENSIRIQKSKSFALFLQIYSFMNKLTKNVF